MSPIRKVAGGLWEYRCLECGGTEGEYTSGDNALHGLTDHWFESNCVQDGVITVSADSSSGGVS